MSVTADLNLSAAAGARPRRSSMLGPVRDAWRLGRVKFGVALTALVVAIALVGPLIAPHGPTAYVGLPFSASTSGAPLGTDYLGHDVISQVLNGGRFILWASFAATTLGVGLGLLVGVVAGISARRVDDTVMRLVDVIYAIPVIVLVLVFISILGSSEWLIIVLVGVAWVPQVARLARGITKDLATREFVDAARLIGVPRHKIISREILPNLAAPLLVEYGVRLTWSIGAIATISFLGFGIEPPHTDWGLMIKQNRTGLTTAPWGVLLPCLCIAAFTIGTNLIADGLARAFAGIDRSD